MRTPARSATRVVILLAIVGAIIWGMTRSDGVSYVGTRVRSGTAPRLILPDDQGGTFDLSAHHGGVVLVYFGYTHCPDVCPATLALMDAAVHSLGIDARRVQQVFVTLDPARNTADTLRTYLSNFDPAPIGLIGSPIAIADAARAWSVTWRPAVGGAFIDHTSVVAVIGPDGTERLRYGFSQLQKPASVGSDLRHILHEG